MPITILVPTPVVGTQPLYRSNEDVEDGDEQFDSEGDVDMESIARAAKRRRAARTHLVTPGEVVTDDPQWMRYNRLIFI